MIEVTPSHKIVGASIKFDGQILTLKELKQGNTGKVRCCSFEFVGDRLKVVVRFDWGDLDNLGNPKLKVNIFRNGVEFLDNQIKWHHTLKTVKDGEHLYIWNPEITKLKGLPIDKFESRLYLTSQQSIQGKSRILVNKVPRQISKKEGGRLGNLLRELSNNGSDPT